jgi:hypothetical protein
MNLRDAFAKLFSDNGIEIDSDALDEFGDDDEVSLDDLLPGKAAGAVEIFLAAGSTQVKSTVDDDGLLWSPIMYEGQWALRPNGRGGKSRVPLKIVAGSSKNQRREIGLKDIVSAFDDQAIESVTVPETHENKPTENHGYIEKLKIGKTKLGEKTVNVLMAGMDIKLPETKRKMELGAVAGRSAGLLYDYERTDTGKKYPVALEHVCLTSRQWLRGMPRFGRKLSMLSEDIPIASLVLSDDGPTEDEYVLALADETEDTDFLSDTASVWPEEESPNWLRDQINAILDGKRADQRAKMQSVPMYVENYVPYYRCKEAKPTEALICDGYEDSANHWIAPINITNGEVELSEPTKWQAIEQVWQTDTGDQTAEETPALSEDDVVVELTNLELSQAVREARARGESIDLAQLSAKKRKKLPPHAFAIPEKRMFPIHDESHARNALARAAGTQYEARVKAAVKKKHPKISQSKSSSSSNYNEPPRGGGKMAGEDKSTLQLSDEARAEIKKMQDALDAERQRNEQLSQTVDKLVGTANSSAADAFIAELKAMKLDEEHGFSGMLNEIHQVMLADDGGPALQSDHFSDDKNKTGEITISDAFRRVFGALKTADGVTLKLGEVIKPPSETLDDEQDGQGGKPPKGDENLDESKMTDAELLALQEKDHPGALEAAGIKLSANGKGD